MIELLNECKVRTIRSITQSSSTNWGYVNNSLTNIRHCLTESGKNEM